MFLTPILPYLAPVYLNESARVLDIGTETGHEDVVKLILRKVVDADDLMLRNTIGQTAREVAVTRRDKRVIRLIEEQEKKYQVNLEEVVD